MGQLVPPYNVLVNPGAETGDLTGWNVSATGNIYAVSTNALIDGPGSGNVLSLSGAYTFELYDTTGGNTPAQPTASIYQDYPAIAGSQWSASCWAICYASNYFSTAIAYMSVTFYDGSSNVLGGDANEVGTYGVFGSAILDPTADGNFGWIIAPPPAVDATGWVYLTATNFYYGYPTPPEYTGTGNPPPLEEVESGNEDPVSPTLTAPTNTAYVRYQLEFDNFTDGAGAVYFDDCDLEKLNLTDPDITNPPLASTINAGESTSFTVGAVQALKKEPLSYQWQKNGTNLPAAGGVNDISGTTKNPNLFLTNCVAADAGLFDVVVSDSPSVGVTNSITSVPVPLTVLTPNIPTDDVLGNPGFEDAPLWAPWNIFNGAYLVCATNVYGTSTNTVNIFDGNWCAMAGDNGNRDNGFWQAITGVTPGTYWKAGGWAYVSSLNEFAGGNTCRLQVWFEDAYGNYVPGTPVYESFKIYGTLYTNGPPEPGLDMQYTNIDTSSPNYGQVLYHTFLPNDTWCYMAVTNMVNNDGIGPGDDLPTNTLPYGVFMVPTNTTPPVAKINMQVYEYCPVSSDGLGYVGVVSDAVYWDDMDLIQVLPVTNLTASVSGTNMNLSFWAGPGLNYTVLYKTNLMDVTWSVLTKIPTNNIAALGTIVIVSDSVTAQSRFYRVQVQ